MRKDIHYRIEEECKEYISDYQKKYQLFSETKALERIILDHKNGVAESDSAKLDRIEAMMHKLSFAIRNTDKNSDIALIMLNHIASLNNAIKLAEKESPPMTRAKEILDERISNAQQNKSFRKVEKNHE